MGNRIDLILDNLAQQRNAALDQLAILAPAILTPENLDLIDRRLAQL